MIDFQHTYMTPKRHQTYKTLELETFQQKIVQIPRTSKWLWKNPPKKPIINIEKQPQSTISTIIAWFILKMPQFTLKNHLLVKDFNL